MVTVAAFPSLQRICVEVLAWSPEPYWQLQKRHMQWLPQEVANTLLQLLLQFRRLAAPVQLDAFTHCATQLAISPSAHLQLDVEWLAHICSLRQLGSLALRGLPRLRDKALTPLPRLAQQLTHLDLQGCTRLTNKALPLLAALTGLHSLVLTGTSMRSPLLGAITSLGRLTRLHLGGCDVSDDDLTHHVTTFGDLRDLDLWGCHAGDASVLSLAQLPALARLSMAWGSRVAARPPLLARLTSLDLSHCRLAGCGDAAVFAAAEAMTRLQELVLVQAELDGMACELMEAVVRSSAASLRVLDLTKLSVPSVLPLLLALEGATALTALSLAGTHLLDDFCPSLAAATGLATLNLGGNAGVTAAGVAGLVCGCSGSLQCLDLRGTAVGDDAVPLLRQLPQLQQLVLADTRVSWECKVGVVGPAPAAAAEAAVGVAVPAVLARAAAAVGVAAAPVQPSNLTTQSADPRQRAVGWTKLRVLDLTGTQLSDAGSAQLAAELQAGRRAGQASAGLQVLLVGGARSRRLGRRTAAALGSLTTLQALTLKACQLSDSDLQHLEALQELQQLHIDGVDPWLAMSDASLLELAECLPSLTQLTRDGQLLWQQPAWQQWRADDIGGNGSSTSTATSWSAVSSTAGAGSSSRSIWPAGPVLDEPAPQPDALPVLPWLQGRSAEAARAASSAASGPSTRRGSSSLPSGWHSAAASGGSKRSGSSGSGRACQRLSAHDERFRYSTERLLTLRDLVTGDAEQAPELPDEIRADGQ